MALGNSWKQSDETGVAGTSAKRMSGSASHVGSLSPDSLRASLGCHMILSTRRVMFFSQFVVRGFCTELSLRHRRDPFCVVCTECSLETR